jgi:hypothetical protein
MSKSLESSDRSGRSGSAGQGDPGTVNSIAKKASRSFMPTNMAAGAIPDKSLDGSAAKPATKNHSGA